MRRVMKKVIVAALAACICGVSFTFAQTKNDEKALIGKWVFESVAAFEDNVQKIPFSMDSLDCCEAPKEMDIQQNEITFVWKESTYTERYGIAVKGGILCFPICAEWKIVGNKLQLSWTQDLNSNPNGLIIVLTYKLK